MLADNYRFTRNEIFVLRGIRPRFATQLAIIVLGMDMAELEYAGFEDPETVLADAEYYGMEDLRQQITYRTRIFDRHAALARFQYHY